MYYGLISRLDTVEDRISDFENLSIEITKERKYRIKVK